MLRIVTGPFHPHLEDALVDEVQTLKAQDSAAPLLLIVPSNTLRQRLTWLLAVERGLCLLDVQILTFHQMALRLLGEAGLDAPASVRPSFFFKELLHLLLRADPAAHPGASPSPWHRLTEMPGAWGALWATLKDLKDAGVPADRDALKALAEASGTQPVHALVALYARLRAELARLRVGDRDDLAVGALSCVATSPLLGRQRRILYYGFYDLTQVQLDLFHAVVRAYPSSLFFPLVRGEPAFAFAERFFDRSVLGLASGPVTAFGERQRPVRAATVRILNAAGIEDEVTVVAKAILDLVEERGYAWHEIGIVARTLAAYERTIPRICAEQRVPIRMAGGLPLSDDPYARTVLQLMTLRTGGFARTAVIDLLASPWLALDRLCPGLADPRPELWDLASRRLGIVKGLDEWHRLGAYVETGLPLSDREPEEPGRGEGDGSGERQGPRIPAAQIRGLIETVRTLDRLLGAWPERGTWAAYAQAVARLTGDVLDDDVDPKVRAAFDEALRELDALDRMGEEPTVAEFAEAAARCFGETTVPFDGHEHDGVHVLDAMSARGLPFRALFVLGLNEKVFPRHIEEDAFLRDATRRMLDADLGYKIAEKLGGFDEERLLFHLLVESASGSLTLSYLRTDETGRPLVPSDYLSLVAGRLPAQTPLPIPRRWSHKVGHARLAEFAPARLTPVEVCLTRLLERRRPAALLRSAHPLGADLLRGLETLRRQEAAKPALADYDGMIGPVERIRRDLTTSGLAPTRLQDYATCPFRYWAAHVLHLDVWPEPDGVTQIGPLERGTLAHRIVTAGLIALRDRGWFAEARPAALNPRLVLEEEAAAAFREFAASQPVGYDLIWRLEQESLTAYLSRALEDELADLGTADAHWEPVLFEAPMQGTLTVRLDGRPQAVPIHGQLDRLDLCRASRSYRVIDYKYKSGGTPHPHDKNLALGAVRGQRLQPPLYLLMAQASLPQAVPVEEGPGDAAAWRPDGVAFDYLAPLWEHQDGRATTRVTFPGDAWQGSLGRKLNRTLEVLVGGIARGEFFIYPADYCERCDFRTMCRRTHQASRWRARADHQLVQPYRLMRRTTLDDEAASPPPAASKPGKGNETGEGTSKGKGKGKGKGKQA
ncbi:MAG: hypothetical protein FJ245_13155 [Nitrospira sp.]|nr:hypothetical protein [Nitrospira sp.]